MTTRRQGEPVTIAGESVSLTRRGARFTARFYIYALIPPVAGGTGGARWNGWACPYFPRESAEAICAAWNKEWPTCSHVNPDQTGLVDGPCAYFDEETRRFWFYCPDSDTLDGFDAETIDGCEVWPIGSHCWTWEAEADAMGGDMGFSDDERSHPPDAADQRAAKAETSEES